MKFKKLNKLIILAATVLSVGTALFNSNNIVEAKPVNQTQCFVEDGILKCPYPFDYDNSDWDIWEDTPMIDYEPFYLGIMFTVNIKFNGLQKSSPTGETKEGYRYLDTKGYRDDNWVKSATELARIITDYIKDQKIKIYDTSFYYNVSTDQLADRDKVINELNSYNSDVKTKALNQAYDFFIPKEPICAEGYTYIPNRYSCVANDDIKVADKYTITDYKVLDLAYWSKGNTKYTYKNKTRRTIAFSLPTDIADFVKKIKRVKITYSTCDHKIGSKCDEEGKLSTVDYYDDNQITIERSKHHTFITKIPALARTSELLAIADSYSSISDAKNGLNEGRLFNSQTTESVADAFEYYVVLNESDTMYIEMIEVEAELYTGEVVNSNTEGSIMQDTPEKEYTILAGIDSFSGVLRWIAIGGIAIGGSIVLVLLISLISKLSGSKSNNSNNIRDIQVDYNKSRKYLKNNNGQYRRSKNGRKRY